MLFWAQKTTSLTVHNVYGGDTILEQAISELKTAKKDQTFLSPNVVNVGRNQTNFLKNLTQILVFYVIHNKTWARSLIFKSIRRPT